MRADRRELAAIRWRHLSYIMQGSMSVLNPVRRVRQSFVDFAFRHIGQPMPAVPRHRATPICSGCSSSPTVLDAYPHELSGGMRQRVTIALATVCRPDFIIADEPTTALDVVVQKDVLAMIREIQREIGSSMLFVTHDMAVHANLADRLGIMYAGRLVEEGRTAEMFRSAAPSLHRAPDRAACRASATSRPSAGPRRRAAQPRRSAARLPLPSALPAAIDICRREVPPLADVAPGHRVACFATRRAGVAMSAPLLERRSHVSTTYYGGGLFARRQVAAVDDVSFAARGGQAGDLHRSSASRAAARPRSPA